MCVGILVVAEVLVRVLISPPMDPGRTLVLENEIPGFEKKVRFRIDENQIRGWDSGKPKPPGALRILCLGGASTSTMLQNENRTWWGQLGAALERSTGKEIQIGCVTAPTSTKILGGAQWVDHLLGEVEGIDLVIAMYGHAEVVYPGADFKFDPKSIEAVDFGKEGGVMVSLAKSCHLLRLVRNARIKSKRNDQQREIGKPNQLRDRILGARRAYRSIPSTTPGPVRASDPIAAYLHGVGLFTEFAKKRKVKLLLVGEPSVFSALISPDAEVALHSAVHVGPGEKDLARPDPSWADSELERFYAAASRVCAGADVPFVNLHGNILPTAANFLTESTLTDAGASEAAATLLPSVEKLLK